MSVTSAEQLPCADCHEEDPSAEAFAVSVHGFLDCADCHTGIEDFPHSEDAREVDCSVCHGDVAAYYDKSIHGQTRAGGDREAPACATCHGDIHQLVYVSDPQSPVHPVRLPETCGSCHADPEMVEKYGIPVAKPIEAFNASVHAQMCEEGQHAATCSSCHDSHAIYAAGDPRSKVFHANVPETCSECHYEITQIYLNSAHGRAAEHGVREAPVCTDCHGEHRILSHVAKESPVFASNIPKMTCGRCHGDLRLADKFDIEDSAVASYDDSYHGLASRAGRATVAHCASCHGVHDILPSSNPESHVHKDNLAQTCGECHPGAGQRYAIGTVHVIPTEREQAVVFWVRWIYLWMIYATIGGMLLHNGLDLYRKARNPLPPPAASPRPARIRMTRGFRIAHLAMIVSFVLLVWTGFALKYPESWWAAPLLRWEGIFGFRGWLHRGAALLMLAALLFHVVHLMVDRRARACIAKMRPTWHDVTEFRERMQWYLGRRKEPVKSPKLGYPEKMEYIALMWGIVVMTVTGFALWFDNTMLRMFPKWFGDVATVIHFYEAILASLAILVWHFYFVIFDPVVYPMDTAWLHGRECPGRTAEREEPEEFEDHEPIAPQPRPGAPNPLEGDKQPAAG
jgi:cytochrome b subunit of formate dehydrogenase